MVTALLIGLNLAVLAGLFMWMGLHFSLALWAPPTVAWSFYLGTLRRRKDPFLVFLLFLLVWFALFVLLVYPLWTALLDGP